MIAEEFCLCRYIFLNMDNWNKKSLGHNVIKKRRGLRQITDVELLRKIIIFLADNIGNTTSLNLVSNTLVSENMIQNRERQGKPATKTIASYVGALKLKLPQSHWL